MENQKSNTKPLNIINTKDSGCYIIILYLNDNKKIKIGKLGKINFYKGYYFYVGSAKKNLSKRIERHKRKRKKFHWHIDYLRNEAEFINDIIIRTDKDMECRLANKLKAITDETIKKFGSSDCNCESHLFRMNENPISNPNFINLIINYRMNKLEKKIVDNEINDF